MTIKTLENTYQLFTSTQQAHQNSSGRSDDKTPRNTGKRAVEHFVFIIMFFEDMKTQDLLRTRCLIIMILLDQGAMSEEVLESGDNSFQSEEKL